MLEVPQKLYEAASDCICSTLYMCEDSPSNFTLAQVLQAEVKKLLPEFKAAVQSEDAIRCGLDSNFSLHLMINIFIEQALCVASSLKWQRASSIT